MTEIQLPGTRLPFLDRDLNRPAQHIRRVERQGRGARVVAAVGDGVVALGTESGGTDTDGYISCRYNDDSAQSGVEGASGGGGNKDRGHGGSDQSRVAAQDGEGDSDGTTLPAYDVD